MSMSEFIERGGKFSSFLSDLAKGVLSLVLVVLVVGALAAPKTIAKRLEEVGLKIGSVDAGFVRLVAIETPKASAAVVRTADSITDVEVQVATTLPPEQAKGILENLRNAKVALDKQQASLVKVAGEAGFERDLPRSAWLYVGYFNESGKPARLNERLDHDALRYRDGKVSAVGLKFDSPVVADGDNCARVDVADAKPQPRLADPKFMILRAGQAEMDVLRVAECPSVARGKQVYVEVSTPPDRVRFAQLNTFGR